MIAAENIIVLVSVYVFANLSHRIAGFLSKVKRLVCLLISVILESFMTITFSEFKVERF